MLLVTSILGRSRYPELAVMLTRQMGSEATKKLAPGKQKPHASDSLVLRGNVTGHFMYTGAEKGPR
jgi:hypothetical protein